MEIIKPGMTTADTHEMIRELTTRFNEMIKEITTHFRVLNTTMEAIMEEIQENG